MYVKFYWLDFQIIGHFKRVQIIKGYLLIKVTILAFSQIIQTLGLSVIIFLKFHMISILFNIFNHTREIFAILTVHRLTVSPHLKHVFIRDLEQFDKYRADGLLFFGLQEENFGFLTLYIDTVDFSCDPFTFLKKIPVLS